MSNDPQIIASSVLAELVKPDEIDSAQWTEWLDTDARSTAQLAALEYVAHQSERGHTATTAHAKGRAKRAVLRELRDWQRGKQTIGGDQGRAMMESLTDSASQSPPYAPEMSGHDGYNVDARDWWDAKKGGLTDDDYNACALVFGLDGHDELGITGAAERLGVCRDTVYERVGRARGVLGEG